MQCHRALPRLSSRTIPIRTHSGPSLASVLRLILRFSAPPGLPATPWPTKKTPCSAKSLKEWSQADPNPLPCSGFVGLLHFVLHQNLHQVLLGIAVPSPQARRADAADLNILPGRIRFFLSSSFLAGDGGLGLWLACQ